MSTWSSIGGAVCVAVTVLGLLLSWRVWRKKGVTRGLRAVAWSLLPLAAYLTHSVKLIGRLVQAVVLFAGSFVFSPLAWAGVVVLGISVVLFLASGGLPLLNWRKARERRKLAAQAKADGSAAQAGQAGQAGQVAGPAGQANGGQPAAVASRRKAPVPGAAEDDDMGDIQEILRRRGIK
jgi:hypothetical protein